MVPFFQKIYSGFLNILFPKRCIGCHISGVSLCDKCFSTIRLKRFQVCPICKKSSYMGMVHHEICQTKTSLNGLLVVAHYHENPFLEESIKYFKYKGVQELGQLLGQLLIKQLLLFRSQWQQYVLVPIPLHRKRKSMRGFNQSEIFVKVLSETLHIPSIHCLVRQKNTKQQARLSREERLSNMQGAFQYIGKDIPEKVLLIDDVASTLATLEEAARILKQVGVKEVVGCVLARGK